MIDQQLDRFRRFYGCILSEVLNTSENRLRPEKSYGLHLNSSMFYLLRLTILSLSKLDNDCTVLNEIKTDYKIKFHLKNISYSI